MSVSVSMLFQCCFNLSSHLFSINNYNLHQSSYGTTWKRSWKEKSDVYSMIIFCHICLFMQRRFWVETSALNIKHHLMFFGFSSLMIAIIISKRYFLWFMNENLNVEWKLKKFSIFDKLFSLMVKTRATKIIEIDIQIESDSS